MSSKSTAEMLQDLIDSKYDMKSAIEEYGLYGVTVEGGLVTYDEAIKNISSKILTSEKETIICEPGLAFQTNIVVPLKVDLRNLTSANHLFHSNSSYDSGIDKGVMETIHIYSSKNVTDMSWMFFNCTNLTNVPAFDTSNATDMSGMFWNCTNLTAIPELDTSNVTNMNRMFNSCESLITIPLLDTSSVTNMYGMFYDCNNLTTIPLLDTSKVTNMSSMFYNCISLTTIPLLDTSNVTNMTYMFEECDALTNVGGFKNLGMQESISDSNMPSFKSCKKLTRDSMLNIFNNLYDRASAGYHKLTINFDATIIFGLTDEEKAIATNKGWILSFI